MRSSHALLLFAPLTALLSLSLSWERHYLGHSASAWKISALGEQIPFLPPLGLFLFILILISLYAVLMGGGKKVVLASLIFMVITAERIVQLGLSEPRHLQELIIENQQLNSINTFNANFSPINSNSIPNLWPVISTDHLGDRLQAAWYFLDLGWYWALIAGILWFGAAIAAFPNAFKPLHLAKIGGSITFALLLFHSLGPLLGQRELLQAHNLIASGRPQEASEKFQRAFKRDPWNAQQWGQQILAGTCDQLVGQNKSDFYKAWKADLLFRTKQTESSFEIMQNLSNRPGALGYGARTQLVSFLNTRGSSVYGQKAYGAAAYYWQRAIRLSPDAFDTETMLIRSFYTQSKYFDVIHRSNKLIARMDLDCFIANSYADKGDALTVMRDFKTAKTAYSKALKLDEILNYRTLTALTGP